MLCPNGQLKSKRGIEYELEFCHLFLTFIQMCIAVYFKTDLRGYCTPNQKSGEPEGLSESLRCNDMVADLHFPRFFSTANKCEIARRFPRSVVKVGLHVQCKNISILSGVQPRTSTDLKLSYFNT